MANKKTKSVRARRRRRTDEELIQDLKARIQEVQARSRARELKKSPQLRSAVSALKALDRALDVAAEEEDTVLRHVLADARKILGAHLEEAGFDLPKANLPRGRRPKSAP